MRIQFSIKENDELAGRKEKNENYEGMIFPVDSQGNTITLGIKINDIFKFNMFLEKFINDQNTDKEASNTIGAELIFLANRPPIIAENISYARDLLTKILEDGMKVNESQIEENNKYETVDNIEDSDNTINEETEIISINPSNS